MEALKKKLTSQFSSTTNKNQSRGTSSPATSTNEGDVEQQTEKPFIRTLSRAIRPRPHEDEPNAKRPKTTSAASPTTDGQDMLATTPNSEAIENEEGSGLREEQLTPAVEGDNNETTTTTSEQPPSSGTSTAPETPKVAKENVVVGSEKWKEMKRISHMEVERRRRETINDHINELALMIPTENRQKGAILRATVAHIKSLKEQHDADTKKWALEKLVTEQTIRQLQEDMEKYKTRYLKLRKMTKDDPGDASSDDSNDDEQQTTTANPPSQ